MTNALGFTLADHKRDLKRAEELIRASLVAQPDDPALFDLGWVLYQHEQDGSAVGAAGARLPYDGDIGAH